jgi:hypothetical protein
MLESTEIRNYIKNSSHVEKLPLVQVKSDENFKKLYSRSNKLIKLSRESIFRGLLTYISNNVPTGAFVFVYRVMERKAYNDYCA